MRQHTPSTTPRAPPRRWCELPACEASKAERAAPVLGAPPRQCTGEPLSACPSSCNGRGSCLGGACRCYAGFRGAACEESDKDNSCLQGCSGRGECLKGFCRCTPPWWGADCALGATASEWPRCSRRRAGAGACSTPLCPGLLSAHANWTRCCAGLASTCMSCRSARAISPAIAARVSVHSTPWSVLQARMNVLALKVELGSPHPSCTAPA